MRNLLQHYLSPLHVACRLCGLLELLGISFSRKNINKSMRTYERLYHAMGL